MSSARDRNDPMWQSTWALRRAVLILVVAAGIALVFGQPALALVVLPLAVGTAVALAGQQGQPRPNLRVEMPRMAEVGGITSAVITMGGLESAEIAVLRLPYGIGSSKAPYVVLASDPPEQELTVTVDASRWGMRDYGAAGLRVASADGLFATPVVITHTAPVRILPPAHTDDVPELPARSAGQVGAHRTRRPGDGSELLDVREFRPGDRIRRIDWRVSARRDALHVRHTAIDADADLVICLDTRYDLAADVMTWHERSSGTEDGGGSLGIAIGAATAL